MLIQVAILPGSGSETPLLMSKELLKELGARLDLVHDTMSFARLGDQCVRLGITSKGHYAVPLFDFTHTHRAHHSRACDRVQSSVNQDKECHVVCRRQSRSCESGQSPVVEFAAVGTSHAHGTAPGSATRLGGRFTSTSSDCGGHGHDGGQVQDKATCTSQHLPVHLHMPEELYRLGSIAHRGNKLATSEDLQGLCGDARHQEGSAVGTGDPTAWPRCDIPLVGHRGRQSTERRHQCRVHSAADGSPTSPETSQSDAGERCNVKPHRPQLADGDRTTRQHLRSADAEEDESRVQDTTRSGSTPTTEGRRHGDRDSQGRGASVHLDHVDHGIDEQERRSSRACGEGSHLDAEHPRRTPESGTHLVSACGESDHSSPGRRAVGTSEEPSAGTEELEGSQSGEIDTADTSVHDMNRKTRRKLRRTIETLQEYDCHTSWQKSISRAEWDGPDICEVFSIPRVTQEGGRYELRAGDCFDLQLGDDLLDTQTRNRVYRTIADTKPLICVVCPPCTFFSTIRQPCEDENKEKEERKKAMTLLLFGIEVCKLQMSNDRFFVFEHPEFARSWKYQGLIDLEKQTGVTMVCLDMCMFGMRDIGSDVRIKKGTRLLGNLDEDIMKRMEKRCDKTHEHQVCEGQVKVEGRWMNRTRLAQVYPREFCSSLCECIVEQKRRRERGHYDSNEIMTVEAVGTHGGESHVRESIRRAHQNLGHPSVERFCMMLKHAGASEQAIKYAREYKCPVCEGHQGLKAPKVSKVRRTFEFNAGVCCDTFDLEVLGKKVSFLSMICEGTCFHVVAPLWAGRNAEETRRAYRRSWKGIFGAPKRLFSDNGSEFEGPFQEGLWLDGTTDERSAGFSPWQNGFCERHGGTWKSMYMKMVATFPPTNKEQAEEVIQQVNSAKNAMLNHDGHSPHQRVFGQQARIPGMVYSGDENPHVGINSGYLAGDASFVRAVQMRQEARKAFIDADNEDRIRRAVERRTRPERGPFYPGCKVYVWRPGKKKDDGSMPWFWRGPGTVIGASGSDKVWVSFGTKVLKCSPEQLRRLRSEDEATIRLIPQELIDWSHVTSKRGVATYHDISADGRPPSEEAESGRDYWELNGILLRRIHVQPRQHLYIPLAADEPPVELDLINSRRKTMINYQNLIAVKKEQFDDWREVGAGEKQDPWTGCTVFTIKRRREEHEQPELSTERYADPGPQPMQIEEEAATDTPNSISYTPTEAPEVEPMTSVEEVDNNVPSPALVEQPAHVNDSATASAYGPVRETPLTRAMRQDLSRLDTGRRPQRPGTEALQAELQIGQWTDRSRHWKISWDDGVLIRLHGHQRGPYRPCEKTCPVPLQWLTGRRYSLIRTDEGDGYKVITDDNYLKPQQHHPELHQWTGYSVFEITTPELETTFPTDEHEVYETTVWEGLKDDTEVILEESKRTEVEKLFKYKAMKIIPPAEAQQIRRNKGRILPSRFVITEKPDDKQPGKFKKKARWCIRGYLDPDLHKLEKQAPTLSTEALGLILQVSASMHWPLNIGDVEGAFLQGDQLRRDEGPLYIEPPPGGMPGVPPGSLLMAEKAIYGLADAPKAWHDTLTKSLISTGLKQSCLDPCLFHYWCDKEYHGSLAVHVDDLICTGTTLFEKNVTNKLRTLYPFKHWKTDGGEFLGRQIHRNSDGFVIEQREYAEKLNTIKITRERKRDKEQPLNEKRRASYEVWQAA